MYCDIINKPTGPATRTMMLPAEMTTGTLRMAIHEIEVSSLTKDVEIVEDAVLVECPNKPAV